MHARLLGRELGIVLGQQPQHALVDALWPPRLHLYTGPRLVASLHEQALRAARAVDEHDLGRLDTRIVKAVHGATRQEHDIAARGSERLVAAEELQLTMD